MDNLMRLVINLAGLGLSAALVVLVFATVLEWAD